MRLLLPLALAALSLLQGEPEDSLRYMAGLAAKGLPAELQREAEQFLRAYPNHGRVSEARYRLASAYFEQGRVAEAAKLLSPIAVLSGFDLAPEANFRLGQCELDLGRPKEAAAALERALSFGKEYLEVPARALLGDAQLSAGRVDEAGRSFRRVLELAPKGESAPDAVCGLAWCALRSQDHAAVQDLAGKFLAAFPGHGRAGEVQFLRAEALFELGRPEESLAAYGKVSGEAFADAAVRGAGFACAALGRHADAAEAFALLIQRHPQSRFVEEARLQLGVERLAAGDARGALAALPAETLGASGEGAYWRARALSAAGEDGAALELATRASRGEADREKAARWASLRADLLARTGRPDEARAAYEAADTDYALQAAAVASLEAKRPEEALRLARKLLERNPRSNYRQEALLAAAEALFSLGQHGEAEGAYLAAAEADKDAERRGRSRLRAAWCRYLAGDAVRAAAMFKELSRTPGDGPLADEACFMAARAALDAGDTRSARAGYDKYLERFPQGTRRGEALLASARLADGSEADARLEAALAAPGSEATAAEARFELAERLSKAGDFEGALAHYETLLRSSAPPALAASSRYGQAWCHFSRGRNQEALAALAPLFAQPSGGAPALQGELELASLELSVFAASRQGDLAAAERHFRLLEERGASDTRLWAAASALLEALPSEAGGARRAELLERCARAAKSPAVTGEIEAQRSLLCLAGGDREQALQRIDAAWRAAPQSAAVREAACTVGESCLAANDADSGQGILRALARDERAPWADRAVYRLGHWRLSRGEARGAAQDLAGFVQRFPGSALKLPARFLEAEALLRAGDSAKALTAFEGLGAEDVGVELAPKVLFRVGTLHCKAGRWTEGERELTVLLERFPKFENGPEAQLWQARAQAERGERRLARTTFETLARADRGWIGAESLLSLGELSLASGDPAGAEEALRHFLKVAVLFSDVELVARSNWGAGRALEALGRHDKAAECYREIVDKAPKTEWASRGRERLVALASR
jgi:TolA-binding protein